MSGSLALGVPHLSFYHDPLHFHPRKVSIVAPYGTLAPGSIEYTRVIRCTIYTLFTVLSKETCNMGLESRVGVEHTHIIRAPYIRRTPYGATMMETAY